MYKMLLKQKEIHLKWGTWAMRRFTDKNKITIDQYFDVLTKAAYDLNTLVQLVHIGYESACTSNKEEIVFTEDDVCDWIDEVGGVFRQDGPLVDYIKYIVDNTLLQVSKDPVAKAEKKKSKP